MKDKKQMSEADIRRLYIDPALESKWDKFRIRTEVKITDGAIDLRGNLVYRQPPKKADYVLYKEDNYPIAIVEAKDNKHTVEAGLQQVMTYADMLDVPFAFSSNGDAFAEYDDITGHTTSQTEFISMDSFPSEQELVEEADGAAQPTDDVRKVEHQSYYSSQNTWPPRYYQQVAINRTLDAIARGRNRLLLVMATGTGKTYVAFQIVYRLLQSGLKKKILYLADRNVLIDQTLEQDFSPLEKVSHKIQSSKEDPVTLSSYQVYFALYQQLCGDNGDEQHYKRLFPNPDFFDLIIVDECHHIAAEKSREALKQLNAKYVYGLSATPKRADGLEKIVYSECGNILFTYKASELAYSRGIAQYFILRFINTPAITNKRGISFTETLNAIAKDERRNVIISDDIETAYSEGRHILILTRRIEQNKALGILLDNKNIPNVVLSSSMKAKDIKAILEQMRGEDISKVLIATDKLLGEGIDIPNLDTLFLASPFMQDGAIQQFAGRLAREHEGKVSTLIYDYVDFTIPRLNYMYAKRLSIYRKLGYVPITDTNKPEAELLFDDISFEDALLQDLGNASSSIIISSSYIVSSKITKTIIDIISSKSLQDIEVLLLFNDKIAEQPAFTALQDKLSRDTIKYRFVESSKNYAVIDNIICWYGDFSLLGQSLRTQQQDERRSMLRIINKEVADCFSNLADYDNLELS